MEINRFSNQFNFPVWNISPQKITKCLLLLIGLLILGNISEKLVIEMKISPRYFVFDQEANFPSLYSALTQ